MPDAPPLPPLTDHAQALEWLDRDPVLGGMLATLPPLPVLSPTPDPFGTLVRSVVGQQLSVKAAASIHARLETALGSITPRTLLDAPPEQLRAQGLSWAKVRTVQALADAALSGQVEFPQLAALPDEAVIRALTPLPGIGRWTVEMFLLFGLARPDVFSFGDLILRQGLTRLYSGATTRAEQEAVAAAWSPYRSLASRAFWTEVAQRRAAARGSGVVSPVEPL